MRRFLIVLFATCLLDAGSAIADEVEVIQLRHRTAEQVIPALRPMLDQGGALSGMQSSLIIRSSRQNIEEIRRVLASIDTVARRLMIYVRQDSAANMARSRASVSARISTDEASVGVNHPGREDGVSARIRDTRTTGEDSFATQVQAVEGNPAFISTGVSVPVPTSTVTRIVNGRVVSDASTDYRDIESGVYVVPHLNGDMVTLEISPQRDTPSRYSYGSANIQHLNTTTSGRLGEWIELGGIAQTRGAQGSGILSSRSASDSSVRSIWVKVEELK